MCYRGDGTSPIPQPCNRARRIPTTEPMLILGTRRPNKILAKLSLPKGRRARRGALLSAFCFCFPTHKSPEPCADFFDRMVFCFTQQVHVTRRRFSFPYKVRANFPDGVPQRRPHLFLNRLINNLRANGQLTHFAVSEINLRIPAIPAS